MNRRNGALIAATSIILPPSLSLNGCSGVSESTVGGRMAGQATERPQEPPQPISSGGDIWRESHMARVIGTDLGTTNSCVAVMEGRNVKVTEALKEDVVDTEFEDADGKNRRAS